MKDGWELRPLSDLCEFQRGLTYSKGDETDSSNNVVLRANNVDLFTNKLDLSELKYISDLIQIPSSKVVQRGSLLVCTASGSKSHLGKVAIIDKDYGYAFGGFMGQITPLRSIHPRFLFYALTTESYKSFISALSDGANINNLKYSDLGRFQIPVPSLPEQQRIVALLDEAFADLANAKANAERNLINARKVFESHLAAIFCEPQDEWPQMRLRDVSTRLTNGYVGPTRDIYRESGIPYLLARHVKDNTLTFDGRTFVSEEFNLKHKKSILNVGDVLLVQSGHIGHSAVVGIDHAGHNCHAMIVITPVEESLSGSFLSLFFSSPTMKKRFQEIRSGSTVPHLTCREVKELMIPVPDLATQHRVVELAREVEAMIQRLSRIYQLKLAALDELKKSLLKQAFNGEL